VIFGAILSGILALMLVTSCRRFGQLERTFAARSNWRRPFSQLQAVFVGALALVPLFIRQAAGDASSTWWYWILVAAVAVLVGLRWSRRRRPRRR
jgi:hypothetical protein